MVQWSWLFGVPGTLAQVLSIDLINGGSVWAYPTLLAGTGLVAIGIAMVCRARGVSPWWSIVAVLPVVGFLFRELWLFGRLRGDDSHVA